MAATRDSPLNFLDLDPTIFKYFPGGILVQNLHHTGNTPNTTICKKKFQKMYRFKLATKKWIFVSPIYLLSHVTKIWKTVFPIEFFSKIWLKVIEYKYIYIAEKKKIIPFKNGSQNNFWSHPQNANSAANFFLLFFHQKMHNWYLGNYEKVGKKYFLIRVLTGDAKNKMLGPSGPLMHLHDESKNMRAAVATMVAHIFSPFNSTYLPIMQSHDGKW